jgi:tripartite-type tricarboxylate transporter receptor subunit TctC
VAEELEARKGWKVIPESVTGKGGGVLAARLAKAPADGTKAIKDGQQVSFAAMSQKLADGAYLLGKAQDVSYNIVTLKGGKAVLDAITAGDVDIGWVAGIQKRGVQSGDLVNLASGEAARLKMSPDAPTLKDLGVDADFGVYFLFAAPKGLPADARDALTGAITEILNDPSSKANAFITKTFGAPETIAGAKLDKYIEDSLISSKSLLEAALK